MRAHELRDPARIFRVKPSLRETLDPDSEYFDPAAQLEAAVLGALLVQSARYFDCVREGLTPEHFGCELHGRLYAAMAELIEAGLQAAPMTLLPRFEEDPEFVEEGGYRYLGNLAKQSAGIIDLRGYARAVRERASRRGYGALSELARVHAAHSEGDLRVAHEELQQVLDDCRPATRGGGMIRFAQALEAAEQANERARERGTVDGVPFGLGELDQLTGGAAKSDLVIVAGRPGMGKSALGLHVALHNARQGKQVAIFTLEMAAAQLANRAIGQLSGVPSDQLRRGKVEDYQAEAARQARPRLAQLPLHLNEDETLDLAAIRAGAKRVKERDGLDLILIDYLQLIVPAAQDRPRVEQLAGITQGLKAMAKGMDVPVIALAQLNRAPEQREDRRPQLADLRESGTIEQDADTVILIYREHYYLSREEPPARAGQEGYDRWLASMERSRDRAELIVAKNRHGAYGTVVAGFDGPAMAFRDLPGSSAAGPSRTGAP